MLSTTEIKEFTIKMFSKLTLVEAREMLKELYQLICEKGDIIEETKRRIVKHYEGDSEKITEEVSNLYNEFLVDISVEYLLKNSGLQDKR